MHGDFRSLFAKTIKHRRDRRRAGTRSAGEGFAASPLPDPHFKGFVIYNLYKLGVDLLRENRVKFKLRTYFFKVKVFNVIAENHRVGVAHWYGGNTVFPAVNRYRFIYHTLAVKQNGNVFRCQNRLAHIDRKAYSFSVLFCNFKGFNAA